MSIALQKAFCPILSPGISHYCKEIEQNRWPEEGALGREEEERQLLQSVKVKEKLHLLHFLAQRDFVSSFVLVPKEKISNGCK